MDEFTVAKGRVIGVRDVSCLQCGMLLLNEIDADPPGFSQTIGLSPQEPARE